VIIIINKLADEEVKKGSFILVFNKQQQQQQIMMKSITKRNVIKLNNNIPYNIWKKEKEQYKIIMK